MCLPVTTQRPILHSRFVQNALRPRPGTCNLQGTQAINDFARSESGSSCSLQPERSRLSEPLHAPLSSMVMMGRQLGRPVETRHDNRRYSQGTLHGEDTPDQALDRAAADAGDPGGARPLGDRHVLSAGRKHRCHPARELHEHPGGRGNEGSDRADGLGAAVRGRRARSSTAASNSMRIAPGSRRICTSNRATSRVAGRTGARRLARRVSSAATSNMPSDSSPCRPSRPNDEPRSTSASCCRPSTRSESVPTTCSC